MKLIKKIGSWIVKYLVGLIIFVVLYLIIAFILSRITVDAEPKKSDDVAIYIKTNGVHTDIVMPVKTKMHDWSEMMDYNHTASRETNFQYIAIGWGDKGFYLDTPQWSELKFSTAFNAVFGLSTSAIHSNYYNKMVENESCKKIMISDNQYKRLIQFINTNIEKDKNGKVIHIITDAIHGKTDAFYEANGSYSLLYTCNSWANECLKKCGQKACLWTAFEKGIFLKY
ncbi:MAG: TIGR02117 family protein [Saprospiraceae bacterium]